MSAFDNTTMIVLSAHKDGIFWTGQYDFAIEAVEAMNAKVGSQADLHATIRTDARRHWDVYEVSTNDLEFFLAHPELVHQQADYIESYIAI